MADTIQTIKLNTKKILKMAADELADNVHFFSNTEKVEDKAFKKDDTGHKPGSTVSVRIPTHTVIQEDNFDITSAIGDVKERTVDLTLDMSATASFDLDSLQLAHDVDVSSVYERFVQPAVYDLAANIESRFLTKATQYVGNSVGTAGSTIFDPKTILDARAKLSQFLVSPKDKNVTLLLDAAAMADATNSNKNLFTFSKKEREDGLLEDSWGTKWAQNELIYNHTLGNDVSCAVEADVVTIATGMTTLGVDGLTTSTGTFTKGTVFTIDNVYAVHPQTKQSLGFLKQFTHVGSTQTANGSGQVTLTLNEPIYSSASTSLQNVNALPVDEATINIVGSASTSYRQGLMWHKKAFRVCSVPLVMPQKAELAEQVTEQGITLALVRDWDQLTRKMVTRIDFLGGLVAVRPTHACRITK